MRLVAASSSSAGLEQQMIPQLHAIVYDTCILSTMEEGGRGRGGRGRPFSLQPLGPTRIWSD